MAVFARYLLANWRIPPRFLRPRVDDSYDSNICNHEGSALDIAVETVRKVASLLDVGQ